MRAATRVLQLPYEWAEMNLEQVQDQLLFSSKRITNHDADSEVIVKYQPQADKVHHTKETLSYWLTERYCFWMIRGHKIVKGPLTHESWTLSHVHLDLDKSIMPFVPQQYLKNNPISHYAKSMHAYLHPFEHLGIYKK